MACTIKASVLMFVDERVSIRFTFEGYGSKDSEVCQVLGRILGLRDALYVYGFMYLGKSDINSLTCPLSITSRACGTKRHRQIRGVSMYANPSQDCSVRIDYVSSGANQVDDLMILPTFSSRRAAADFIEREMLHNGLISDLVSSFNYTFYTRQRRMEPFVGVSAVPEMIAMLRKRQFSDIAAHKASYPKVTMSADPCMDGEG